MRREPAAARHVRVDEHAMTRGCADDEERESDNETDGQNREGNLFERDRTEPARPHQPQHCCRESQSEQRVRRHLDEVPQRRIRKRPEICRVEEQREKPSTEPIGCTGRRRYGVPCVRNGR